MKNDRGSKIINIIKSNWSNLMLAGLFIIFGVVLYVIFHANPENFKDFTAIAWLALVLVTAIYACATVMILIENRRTIREMRQARLDAVKPSLSLQPGVFTLGGGFSSIYLRNSGGVAKEVKVDIEITKPKAKKALFIPAIDRDNMIYLPIENVDRLQRAGGLMKVYVNFKDSYNQSLSDSLTIDFSELKKEGRELRNQGSDLEDISFALREIAREIGNMKRGH